MLTKLFVQTHMFMADRKGVTAIEYAIVAVAIAGIAAAAFGTDGGIQASITAAMTKLKGFIPG
ncbi:Flp family type IVb pilin [Marinomonas gallaica]|uniref:Flp family type IVb pilin n=1 Tax=Marinomonas gallaica TaxID=1806667 RepID=UPI003CE453B6